MAQCRRQETPDQARRACRHMRRSEDRLEERKIPRLWLAPRRHFPVATFPLPSLPSLLPYRSAILLYLYIINDNEPSKTSPIKSNTTIPISKKIIESESSQNKSINLQNKILSNKLDKLESTQSSPNILQKNINTELNNAETTTIDSSDMIPDIIHLSTNSEEIVENNNKKVRFSTR